MILQVRVQLCNVCNVYVGMASIVLTTIYRKTDDISSKNIDVDINRDYSIDISDIMDKKYTYLPSIILLLQFCLLW